MKEIFSILFLGLFFQITCFAEVLTPKSMIAVMDFGTRPGATEAEISLNNAYCMSSEYIITSLVNRGCFVVKDKDLVMQTLRQHGVKTVGIIDPDTAKVIGKILGVNYIFYGNVSGVSLSDVSGGFMVLGNGLKVNVCTVKAHLIGRIMDVNTGDILKVVKGDGVSRSSFTKAGVVFQGGLKIGNATVTYESVHNAIRKGAEDMVDNLVWSFEPEKGTKKGKARKKNVKKSA